jgi:CDP-ribitol ribitolphosphotransferase
MTWLEYILSALWLRGAYLLCTLLPIRQDKVVLASARADHLEGNLLSIYDEIRATRPDLKPVLLLERYSYDLRGKIAYFLRMVRSSYHLATARYFIVDNACLPVHVGPHRRGTTVIQVWHAAGALKVFGVDVHSANREVENRFIHKYYDYVIVGSDVAVKPYASALRTPEERVLPLGVPRTDFFFDAQRMAQARSRVLDAYPDLIGRRVVVYAPTFRGHGLEKHPIQRLDAARLRAALPAEYALVHKLHPVFDPSLIDAEGYDAVIGDEFDINELFTVTDILVTDYSSSIFEYVLLRKPMILLVDDLDEYYEDPGLYVDYRTDMVGELAFDPDDVAGLILADEFDLSVYDGFIERQCQYADGSASARFVEFLSEH